MFYYKQETNYEAPKWMEGEYKLKVHGRKITIERLSVADDGVPSKSHATCHKDDNFDIAEGAKVALDRLKDKKDNWTLKVGDRVEIVKPGISYVTLDDVDPKFASRYRYGCVPNNGTIGKVVGWYNDDIVYVEVHQDKYFGNPEYIDLNCGKGIYAMGISAIKKV